MVSGEIEMKRIIINILIEIKRKIFHLRRILLLLQLILLKNSELINLNTTDSIKYIEKYRKYRALERVKPHNRKRECKLSIIIPIYNAEKYIKACLDSIFSQNIMCSYEVICINDGSIDNSLKILQEYNNENIRIFSQKNFGAGRARNKGLDEARGEYIFFVDSDDILPSEAINNMLRAAFTSDADIISGNIGKASENISMVYYPSKKKDVQTTDLVEACNLMSGTPWGKLYKSHLWEDIRFPEHYAYEDTIVFLNIFPKAMSFLVLSSPVYCFRSSNNSLFKRENSSVRCVDIIWVIKDALDCALQNSISLTDKYYQVLIWHLSVVLYARLKKIDNEILMKNVFIIAIEINNTFLDHYPYDIRFSGGNSKIYYEVKKSFATKDYLLWLTCCKALKNSGEI